MARVPGLPEGPATDLLREALRIEAGAQRALLAGSDDAASVGLLEASALYRASWEAAGPEAYGRLVGHVKAAVLAGRPEAAAAYVREQVGDDTPSSPAAAYAVAIAALAQGDDEVAARAVSPMLEASPAFGRAGAAIAALAAGDAAAYAAQVRAIVEDFERRETHLTGVPIADTALLLERLADARGIAAGERSAMLP